jgi:hypothetical protein
MLAIVPYNSYIKGQMRYYLCMQNGGRDFCFRSMYDYYSMFIVSTYQSRGRNRRRNILMSCEIAGRKHIIYIGRCEAYLYMDSLLLTYDCDFP